MGETLDMVHRRALGPDRIRIVSELTSEARQWLERTGYTVGDPALWQAARITT